MKENNNKYNIDDDFTNFNFKDLDEIIEKLFGNISNLPNLSDMMRNTHHHSISYRFGEGMDKPEIRINGEPVDEERLNDLLGKLGPDTKIIPTRLTLNSSNGVPELDARDLTFSETSNGTTPHFEKAYYEVEHGDESSIITIELPGVEEEHIVISQSGNRVIIIGESDFTAYKVELDIGFEHTKTDIQGNNYIYQIKLSKVN